jgi:hypothetical protein
MTRTIPALTLLALLTACSRDADQVEGDSDALTAGASGLVDMRAPTVRNLAVIGATQLQDGRRVVSDREVVITADVTDQSGISGVCVGEGLKECTTFEAWDGSIAVELSPADGQKLVQLWFKDGRGNVSRNAHGVRVSLDRYAPEGGSVSANLRPSAVALDWRGFVDEGVGVAGYMVVQKEGAFPADCDDGEVIYVGEATSTQATDLVMGQRTAWRVCAIDAVGHISAGAVVDAVPRPELDGPAIAAFATADGRALRTNRVVDLRVDAADPSGVAAMCISIGPSCSDWTAYSPNPRVVLPADDGKYPVFLWLEDGLGNRTSNPARLQLELVQPIDMDGDGVDARVDCDDKDANVRPGAPEVCNGFDDNCDGLADDADPGLLLSSGFTFHVDGDADGWGDPASIVRACLQPAGTAPNSGDCDDTDANSRPGAPEACDSEDDDCDGVVDEDQALATDELWYSGDAGSSSTGFSLGGSSTWGAAHIPFEGAALREQLVLGVDRPAGAAFALAMDVAGVRTGPEVLSGVGDQLRLRVNDDGVSVWGADGVEVSVPDASLPPSAGARALIIMLDTDRAHVYVDGVLIAEDVPAVPKTEVVLAGEGGVVEVLAAVWTCET